MSYLMRIVLTRRTRHANLELFQGCASVVDGGPTLNQHYVNVSRLLGSQPLHNVTSVYEHVSRQETLGGCWPSVGLRRARIQPMSFVYGHNLLVVLRNLDSHSLHSLLRKWIHIYGTK